jgi:hypothetical protein
MIDWQLRAQQAVAMIDLLPVANCRRQDDAAAGWIKRSAHSTIRAQKRGTGENLRLLRKSERDLEIRSTRKTKHDEKRKPNTT